MATLAEIEEQMNRVPAFRGVCMFLSNYYSVKIRYNGNEFWSAEQLYHYMKCTDYKSRFIILHANHKNLAKWGKACQLRPDWMEKRFVYMKEILRAKFHQGGRELAQRLVDIERSAQAAKS